MRNLKVLIFSATYGAGHIRAAEAIIEEIHKQNPCAEVFHMDWAAMINQPFNNLIKNVYLGMITHAPGLWGKFYYGTANIPTESKIQNFLNNIGRSRFKQCVETMKPDLIICTYPTIAGVLAQMRLRHMLDVPLVTVVTDYTVHNQWIHQGVDLYIVGSNQVYEGFVARGIDPQRIQVTGIPVNPRFENEIDRSEIMNKLGLSYDRTTFLIMGGAYGVLHDLKGVCKLVADMPNQVQSLVVCGWNERLYNSLDDIIADSRNPMIRFRYANNVEELMAVADVIITKAGGLIISEALTRHLPMVIFKPIPGQEEENTKFITNIGAGKAANQLEDLESIIRSLLRHPKELEKMREAASRALPDHISEQAVKHILSLTDRVKENALMG